MSRPNHPQYQYLQRLLLTVGIIGLFIAFAALIWALTDVLLLMFVGVLLAIILRTLAKFLARHTPLSARWALILILLLLLALLGLGGWLIVPEIVTQGKLLVDQIGAALNRLEAVLSQYGFGEQLFEEVFPLGSQQPFRPNIVERIRGTFTQTLGLLSHVLFILFTGLFVAFDPEMYRQGLVRLIPPKGRSRTREIINNIISGLRDWLLGRFISMVVTGVVAIIGLWLLNIPFALVLGLLTGLLEFIPIVGSILSAGPAILIAFTLGLKQTLYVAIFYLALQQLEGNIFTPIIQQKIVSLPPALTLSAVLAMGLLFGPIGVLVATPLAVVLFILVKELYLKDLLERDSRSP